LQCGNLFTSCKLSVSVPHRMDIKNKRPRAKEVMITDNTPSMATKIDSMDDFAVA